jgi:hypothetical protein
MSVVKNLDSKNSTLATSQESLNPSSDSDLDVYVSGKFDVRAQFDFRFKSPWTYFHAFLGKLLG